mgnify:CR=1 FL=1
MSRRMATVASHILANGTTESYASGEVVRVPALHLGHPVLVRHQ